VINWPNGLRSDRNTQRQRRPNKGEIPMIERLESMLNRKLTDTERRYIDWLQGWDRETIDVFAGLFAALYEAGKVSE
jgi:hypothetical protein